MRGTRLTFILLFLLVIAGCKDASESPNMSVERYIELLKEGKYDYWQLPDFSPKDIPKLLTYRNENQTIVGFPMNTLSSSLTPECPLGIYVLWTIESIRAKSIGSPLLYNSFPSQNPVIEKREDRSYIEQNHQIQTEVADAYFEWWESNKGKDFSKFHQIDPLGSTEYRWH
jgi:hypothetical protein